MYPQKLEHECMTVYRSIIHSSPKNGSNVNVPQLMNGWWSSHHDSAEANPTRIQEDNTGSIPGLAPWVKDLALL